MVMNADRLGGPSTADDDPRITRVGKFLRKYKLDELPQLINVLKGEMSIVGPRPEVPSEVETYSEEEKRILSVKPGITDWASIKFRNEGEILKGYEDPHKAYREIIKPEKLKLALQYVDEASFSTDLKIILKTVKLMFFKENDS
jgi:lipopolysaccharide/colanic/teichoic acid biosynthesis glycosyltransferase